MTLLLQSGVKITTDNTSIIQSYLNAGAVEIASVIQEPEKEKKTAIKKNKSSKKLAK